MRDPKLENAAVSFHLYTLSKIMFPEAESEIQIFLIGLFWSCGSSCCSSDMRSLIRITFTQMISGRAQDQIREGHSTACAPAVKKENCERLSICGYKSMKV